MTNPDSCKAEAGTRTGWIVTNHTNYLVQAPVTLCKTDNASSISVGLARAGRPKADPKAPSITGFTIHEP